MDDILKVRARCEQAISVRGVGMMPAAQFANELLNMLDGRDDDE